MTSSSPVPPVSGHHEFGPTVLAPPAPGGSTVAWATPAPGAVATDIAIETDGLIKRFGSATVVDRVALRVPAGAVYGFLGPNGSGKTTTIRMLLGLLTPDGGDARLLGRPIDKDAGAVLPHVGALIDGPAFYPWLTGRQNLWRLDASGPDGQRRTRHARIEDALARVGLTAAGDKKFKAYSLGMRQRLGLANALLRPRQLLILDEPTNGMDPQGTREIRHLVRELAADGTTVFLSSHLLAEIEQVCTHVGVMSAGALISQGSLAELRAKAAPVVVVDTDDPTLAATVLAGHGLLPQVAGTQVTAPAEGLRPEALCKALVDAGVGVRAFNVQRPSLEDTFVALTGEGFDVAQ
jgi:ABC-2 type transport system ATP-binding protein